MDDMPEKRKNDEWGFASDLSVWDTLGKAWQVVRRYTWHFVGLGIAYWALMLLGAIVVDAVVMNRHTSEVLYEIGRVLPYAYTCFFVLPLTIGFNNVFLKAARNETPTISNLLSVFRQGYRATVVLILLIGGVGGVLLSTYMIASYAGILELLIILPLVSLLLVYFSIREMFLPFLILDDRISSGMGLFRGIRTSWQITSRHKWQVIGLMIITCTGAFANAYILLFATPLLFDVHVLAVIVGVITMSVACSVYIMWIASAFAVFYHSVALQDGIPGMEKRKNDFEYAYS